MSQIKPTIEDVKKIANENLITQLSGLQSDRDNTIAELTKTKEEDFVKLQNDFDKNVRKLHERYEKNKQVVEIRHEKKLYNIGTWYDKDGNFMTLSQY